MTEQELEQRRELLQDMRRRAELGGGEDRIERQHSQGKYTARERVERLIDPGTFIEFDRFVIHRCQNFGMENEKFLGDGVVTGIAKINQQKVAIYSQDFTCWGGSLGEAHAKKICKIMDFALENRIPLVGINDSGGARIQEGVESLAGYAEIFYRNVLASGVIPQISLIMGPCAGIAVYSPALTDFVFMVDKTSYMFITGPDVVKSVTGEKIDFIGLGGADIHNKKSGVAHFSAKDEKECILKIKKLLTYLPQNNLGSAPTLNMGDNSDRFNNSLKDIAPLDPKKSYDVKNVIKEVVDKNSFFEIHSAYAQNCVVGLARLNNNVVGVVANQPSVLAGCLDINSSDKISRFVRFCDSFNIPLINLVDVTGYLPGTEQEYSGVIRHGAKILYAYSEASVPKISLVLRKAYGGAYIAMVSKEMGYDYTMAWPMAEIAVMGAEQAVNIINRKDKDKVKKKKAEEFSEKFLNPYVAAKQGKIDKIIDPKETRIALINALEMLISKREKRPSKKHGNMPL